MVFSLLLTRKILRILFVVQDLLLIIFIIVLRYVFLNKNKRLLLHLFSILFHTMPCSQASGNDLTVF